MSELEGIKKISDLVDAIKQNIGRLLGSDTTVAITNSAAEIKYIDSEIKDFSDFIISFTRGNFELLNIGDHSLPLSGTNIAFFKISYNALVILHSPKGPVGQLLAFKGRMNKYATKIDELLETEEGAAEEATPAKAAARVPVLTVSIANKKFGMDEAKVLHLVNGENTIATICEKTGLPQLKVDEILRKYQKKNWIKLKRVIIGVTEKVEKEQKKKPHEVPKKQPELAPKLEVAEEFGVESVYIFPILETEFDSKKFPREDAIVLQLCNGQYTIEDIIAEAKLNRLQIMEILNRYEKKGKLKLTKILPSTATQMTDLPSLPAEPQQMPEFTSYTQYPSVPTPNDGMQSTYLEVAPENEENVFNELMDIMNEAQPVEQGAPETVEAPHSYAPSYPSAPSIPLPPNSVPSIPVAPKPESPSVPVAPAPAPAESLESPRIPRAPQEMDVSVVKGEPVTDALFDDLSSLLDGTAPLTQGAMEVQESVSQSEPAAVASPQPATSESISGNDLLEESAEGIRITTYPEPDQFQNRLDRLSNILEETAEEKTIQVDSTEVKVVGSKAICPNCKTHVIMMAKICPNCNRALRTCPNCKSAITLFARICPSCGSLL